MRLSFSIVTSIAIANRYTDLSLRFSYQNQKEVAAGIKRAFQDVPGLKREDLFIVSSSRPPG
jgi:L-glyceraldehyde reductase